MIKAFLKCSGLVFFMTMALLCFAGEALEAECYMSIPDNHEGSCFEYAEKRLSTAVEGKDRADCAKARVQTRLELNKSIPQECQKFMWCKPECKTVTK